MRDARSMPGPGDLWRRRDNPHEAPDPAPDWHCSCGWEGCRREAILTEADEAGNEYLACPECGNQVRKIEYDRD